MSDAKDGFLAFGKLKKKILLNNSDFNAIFGRVVSLSLTIPPVSYALIAREMLNAGLDGEEITLGLEMCDEFRASAGSGSPVSALRKIDDRERNRARARREECDLETWAVLRRATLARDGFKCVYCGTEAGPFEADHVLPLSRDGKSSMRNLACACKPCNASKRDLTLDEWRGRI